MSPNITSKIAGLDDSFTILLPRLQRSFTRSYLMKSNIRHPVVVLLVRGYSVRQVEAAAGDKVRESHPLIAWFLGLDSNKTKNRTLIMLCRRRKAHGCSRVSARGLEDVSFDLVHNQDGGLLDGPSGPLLVPGYVVE